MEMQTGHSCGVFTALKYPHSWMDATPQIGLTPLLGWTVVRLSMRKMPVSGALSIHTSHSNISIKTLIHRAYQIQYPLTAPKTGTNFLIQLLL
jgi:hypothetical protein